MKKIRIVILYLCIFTAGIFLADCCYGAGNTAAEFLLIRPGAKASSLSGAYSATCRGIDSILWNPAGLAKISKGEITLTKNSWLLDTKSEFLAFGFKSNERTIGLGIHNLDFGKFVGMDSQVSDTYEFSADSRLIILSCALQRLYSFHSFGINVKYIEENLAEYSRSGIGIDAGWQYSTDDNLMLGASIENIGPKMKYACQEENLPLSVTCGIGYIISGITVELDVRHFIYDKETNLSIGMEYITPDIFYLRGGLSQNKFMSEGIGFNDIGLSCGIGFKLDEKNNRIDYSLMPFGKLGTTHQISLSLKF